MKEFDERDYQNYPPQSVYDKWALEDEEERELEEQHAAALFVEYCRYMDAREKGDI